MLDASLTGPALPGPLANSTRFQLLPLLAGIPQSTYGQGGPGGAPPPGAAPSQPQQQTYQQQQYQQPPQQQVHPTV
jgi:hypothetical protein